MVPLEETSFLTAFCGLHFLFNVYGYTVDKGVVSLNTSGTILHGLWSNQWPPIQLDVLRIRRKTASIIYYQDPVATSNQRIIYTTAQLHENKTTFVRYSGPHFAVFLTKNLQK